MGQKLKVRVKVKKKKDKTAKGVKVRKIKR